MSLSDQNRMLIAREVGTYTDLDWQKAFTFGPETLNALLDAARAEGAQPAGHLIDGKRFSLHAGDRYRHVKRGSAYTLPFGRAEAMVQCEEPISDEDTLLIYIGDDGTIFARPTHEFFDGRFQPASGQEGSAEDDGASMRHMLSVQASPKPLQAEGAPAAEGARDARSRVELDTDSGLPQVRIVSEQTWITWSPSVSAFGVDIPVEQLVQQARSFVAALSPPAAEGKEDAVLAEARDAIDFLDRVRAASPAEQIAVGHDHWDRVEKALRAVAALSHTPAPTCAMCGGRGEIGGWVSGGSSPADGYWDSGPCPDCTPAPAAEPVAYRVSCANGEWFYQTDKPTAFNPAHVEPLYASPPQQPVEISREIEAIILDLRVQKSKWAGTGAYAPMNYAANRLTAIISKLSGCTLVEGGEG